MEANIGEIRLEDHLLRKNPKGFYVLTLPDGTSTDRLFKKGKWAKRPSTEASLHFETKTRPKHRRHVAIGGVLAAVAATVAVGVWYMQDPADLAPPSFEVAKNEGQGTNGPVLPFNPEQSKAATGDQEQPPFQEEVPDQKDTPPPTIKLTQRDEQTLIHLHKSVSQMLQHHRNTVGAFIFIIAKIKALEPEFVRGIEQNNAFASPQLREKWRRICQQTLTDAEIASIAELGPLDKQVALGEPLLRADLIAFRNRLWIQGKALEDTLKQDQEIKSFLNALPSDYRTNIFEVHASPEEATIERSSELSLACLKTCFDRQSDRYAKTFTIRDAYDAVKNVDCERMGMLFFYKLGLCCSFTRAGLNITTVRQDYESGRQSVMAMLATSQPPKQPPEALSNNSITVPWTVAKQEQGQGQKPNNASTAPWLVPRQAQGQGQPLSSEDRLWVNTRGQKAKGRLLQIDGGRVLLAYPAGQQEWMDINTLGPRSREYIATFTGQNVDANYTGCPYCSGTNLECTGVGFEGKIISFYCHICKTTLEWHKDELSLHFPKQYLDRLMSLHNYIMR